VEDVSEAADQEQEEWNRCQQDIERDTAGEEEDVVLGTVVPDAAGVFGHCPRHAGGDANRRAEPLTRPRRRSPFPLCAGGGAMVSLGRARATRGGNGRTYLLPLRGPSGSSGGRRRAAR